MVKSNSSLDSYHHPSQTNVMIKSNSSLDSYHHPKLEQLLLFSEILASF
jgi:hypothetical protein